MAKLNIKVSMVVDTGTLVVHNHEKSKEETVKGKKLITMLSEADPEKIGFEVAAENDGTFISFVFNRPSGKKGSVIEVTAKSDNSGLTGKIEGQFEIKLRTGVAPFLEKYGKDLDLRIRAVTLNDGSWSGFSAYPVEVDGLEMMDNYFLTLPKVNEFAVK